MKNYRAFAIIYIVFNVAMMIIGALLIFNTIEMNTVLAIITTFCGLLNLIAVIYKILNNKHLKE